MEEISSIFLPKDMETAFKNLKQSKYLLKSVMVFWHS